MAERTLIVRVIGDDRSLQSAMKRDQAAVTQFGAASTSSLGRVDTALSKTKRLAAGGFIGGAAFVAAGIAIRSVTKNAADAQQILGQTKVALEATGKSWEDYGAQIEAAVAKQSKLGFDDEALLQTFSLFVRQTNDVGKALEENNLAMDVARARFIDLESAAGIVNKAALGMAGSLRRLGIDTKGATSGTELLTLLTEKYGGSAQKAAGDASTAFDRAQVSIDNLQEAIGGNLLPTVGGLADTLTETLNLLGRLGDVKIPPIHIPLIFDTGGGTLGGLAHKAAFTLPEFVHLTEKVVGNLIDDFKDQTDKATPKAVQGVAVTFSDFLDNVLIKASTLVNPSVSFGDLLQNPLAGTVDASGLTSAIQKALGLAKDQIGQAITAQKKGLQDAAKEAAAQKLQEQFNALIAALQLNVDKAGLTAGLNDDLKALESLKAGLEKQIKAGVDVTATQSALVGVVGQIADKQEEIRQKAAQAVQARQFRALGLSGTGEDLIPGVENLRKQLGSLTRRLAESGADLPSKLAQQLAGARKVLSGELGKATSESRSKINELFKTIRDTFDQQSKQGPLTRNSVFQANKILEGLGLSPEIEQQIRRRVNAFNNADVRMPSFKTGATATSGGAAVIVENHNTITLDGDVVARNTTRSQQKTRRRNPVQKRGPNRGI
jgi:hypothetical protein